MFEPLLPLPPLQNEKKTEMYTEPQNYRNVDCYTTSKFEQEVQDLRNLASVYFYFFYTSTTNLEYLIN